MWVFDRACSVGCLLLYQEIEFRVAYVSCRQDARKTNTAELLWLCRTATMSAEMLQSHRNGQHIVWPAMMIWPEREVNEPPVLLLAVFLRCFWSRQHNQLSDGAHRADRAVCHLFSPPHTEATATQIQVLAGSVSYMLQGFTYWCVCWFEVAVWLISIACMQCHYGVIVLLKLKHSSFASDLLRRDMHVNLRRPGG